MNKKVKSSPQLFDKFLTTIEKTGNALPHPATIFAIFALAAILFSALADVLGWFAIHPATKEIISPVNLVSKEGLHQILREMVRNYVNFSPLGIVNYTSPQCALL